MEGWTITGLLLPSRVHTYFPERPEVSGGSVRGVGGGCYYRELKHYMFTIPENTQVLISTLDFLHEVYNKDARLNGLKLHVLRVWFQETYVVSTVLSVPRLEHLAGGHAMHLTFVKHQIPGEFYQWPIRFGSSRRLTRQLIGIEKQCRQVDQMSKGVWDGAWNHLDGKKHPDGRSNKTIPGLFYEYNACKMGTNMRICHERPELSWEGETATVENRKAICL